MLVHALTIAAGDTDCEAIHDGWLLQPVNAVSSLAFSLAGLAIMTWAGKAGGHERRLRVLFGFAMIATGLGSFLFHGFDSAVTQFLHDVTFLVTIWILAVINVSELRAWTRPIGWGIVATGVGLFSMVLVVWPAMTNVLTVVVSLALVAADMVLWRKGSQRTGLYWLALGLMALALASFVLGRTSAPLCDPASLVQGHAAWHLFAAIAITAYFVETSRSRMIRDGSLA